MDLRTESKRRLIVLIFIAFLSNTSYAVEPKWAWYDYLCLVCSLAYKEKQLTRVIEEGSYPAACDLQNGQLTWSECSCNGEVFDPFLNHCHHELGVIPFNIKNFLKTDQRVRISRRYTHICTAKQTVGTKDFHYEFLIEPAAPQIELSIALTKRNQPPHNARQPERDLFRRMIPKAQIFTDSSCTMFSTGTVDGGTLLTNPEGDRVISAINVHRGCQGQGFLSYEGQWVIEHFTWSIYIPESGRIANRQVAQCSPL